MLGAVTLKAQIPKRYRVQRTESLVDKVLARLSPIFGRMYASDGRASVPAEHLLNSCRLMALF